MTCMLKRLIRIAFAMIAGANYLAAWYWTDHNYALQAVLCAVCAMIATVIAWSLTRPQEKR